MGKKTRKREKDVGVGERDTDRHTYKTDRDKQTRQRVICGKTISAFLVDSTFLRSGLQLTIESPETTRLMESLFKRCVGENQEPPQGTMVGVRSTEKSEKCHRLHFLSLEMSQL